MAAPCEHGRVRIKVQVVATLLPFNVPVHVNSFWLLITFSESKRIRHVEDNILIYLNNAVKESEIEMGVHDGPISPSWTYLPVSQSSITTVQSHEQNTIPNKTSVNNIPVQELTVFFKPNICKYGTRSVKPTRPILMSSNLSRFLSNSVRLVFKKQAILMQGCMLLSDSKTDILRDNDVLVFVAVCSFTHIAAADPCSKSQETASRKNEVDLADKTGILFDTDEEIISDHEFELSPEIKTKFNKILQKLTSLKNCSSCTSLQKNKRSRKRKINQEDREKEWSDICNADQNQSNEQEQQQKHKSTEEELTHHSNVISLTTDVECKSNQKRKKKKKSEVQYDLMDASLSHSTDEVLQKSQISEHKTETDENMSKFCQGVDEVCEQLLKTCKKGKEKSAELDSSNLISDSISEQIVENIEFHQTKSIKSSKEKKRSEIKVNNIDLKNTSLAHITEETIHKSQSSPQHTQHNVAEENRAKECSSVKVQVSSPTVNTSSAHRRKKPNFGLSNLISSLRIQQAEEVDKSNHKLNVINKETDDKSSKESALENTQQNESFTSKQFDSSQKTPKRKRIRKRKNKRANVINTSIPETIECRKRDYTMRLFEHNKPQNHRMTFVCDSENEDEKDDLEIIQTTGEEHSTLSLDPIEHHVHSNITVSYCPEFKENYSSKGNLSANLVSKATTAEPCTYSKTVKSENGINKTDFGETSFNKTDFAETSFNKTDFGETTFNKTDFGETSFNKTGVAINPDEKFKALLNQCGRIGRQFETISSNGGHAVIRGLRQKRDYNRSKFVDAVDPSRDVLTNKSIVTKSKVCEYVEPIASTSRDFQNEIPSRPNELELDEKQLSTTYFKATQKNKCAVPDLEVIPLSKNYIQLPELYGWPLEGDIIAYKILEMSQDYTPGLSDFKEAKVINVNTQTGDLLLESRINDSKIRSGRFEMISDDTKAQEEENDNLVAVAMTDLVNTKLVYRDTCKE